MYAKVAGPREQDISISILLNLVPYRYDDHRNNTILVDLSPGNGNRLSFHSLVPIKYQIY